MRRFLVQFATMTTCISLGASLLLGSRPYRPSPRAQIRMEYSRDFSFGTVPIDSPISFDMKLTNTSTVELKDVRFWTTCGCTLLKGVKPTIPAGTSIVVTGVVDTSSEGGRDASVYLSAAQFAAPLVIGRVRARVGRLWQPSFPGHPAWNIDREGDELPDLNFELMLEATPTSVRAECASPGISLGARFDGKFLRLTPTVKFSRLIRGSYDSTFDIICEGTSPALRRYSVPVRVSCMGSRYSTDPASLAPGFCSPGQGIPCSFAVLRDGRRISPNGVKSLDEDVSVADFRIDESQTVTMTLVPDDDVRQSRFVNLQCDFGDEQVMATVVLGIEKPGPR